MSAPDQKETLYPDLVRPGSACAIVPAMIIHRYLLAHYQQVPVYFWPILFFELWRVDRWTAETGRQAFVQVDRYGRAWVPYFEGMARNFAAYDIATRFYSPSDVDALCPDVFERAIVIVSDCPRLDPRPHQMLPLLPRGNPDQVRDDRALVRLDPG